MIDISFPRGPKNTKRTQNRATLQNKHTTIIQNKINAQFIAQPQLKYKTQHYASVTSA